MTTKHAPLPWTVYRCDYCEPETACGLNGTPFDCANDECHHPLDLADAEFIVRACNSHDDLLAALKGLASLVQKQVKDVPLSSRSYEDITALGSATIAIKAAEGE